MAWNNRHEAERILDLKWENVSLSEGHIRIEETKNNESRYIPINNELNKTLKLVQYKSSGEHVFSHEGYPVKSFKTAFDNAVRRSGVKRGSPSMI